MIYFVDTDNIVCVDVIVDWCVTCEFNKMWI